MKHLMKIIWLITMSTFVICCNDDESLEISMNDIESINSLNLKSTSPVVFDWENVDKVPTGNDVNINMPWSGSNGLFDPQIRLDYKKSDGWKMLYNTFEPVGTFQNGSYFALYNKYRGILRFYFYIMPNNHIYSNYLEEELEIFSPNGSITSCWNFVNQEVIDPEVNKLKSNSTSYFPVPSEGGWYVSEFDIGYDPNLNSKSYTDLWFLLSLKFWNIEQTSLTGTINGDATLVSNRSISPFSILDLIQSSVTNPIKTTAVLSSLKKKGLNSTFKKEIEKVKQSGVGAIVKGVTNLIMTGNPNSGSTQTHYKIDLDASFSGTNTSSGNVKTNFQITMPGLSNSTSGIGPVPVDNIPLGIYNISSRPIVYVKNTPTSNYPCFASYGLGSNPYEYTFYLSSTFLKSLSPSYSNNVYNPHFLQIANVTQGYTYFWDGYGAPGPKIEILVGTRNTYCDNGYQIVGKNDCSFIEDEFIDGLLMKNISPATRGNSSNIIGNGMFRNDTPIYLRITFDVIPKNGSPRSTIIKTFKCNVSSWI